MQTHRQIAKRKTAMWQIAAMGILALSGAAAALPTLGRLLEPPIDKNKGDDFPAVAAKPITAPDPQAMDDAIAALNRTTGWVKPPDPPKTTTDIVSGSEPPPPPPPPSASEWTYLGSIITPRSRRALVQVAGQKQIYSVGSTSGADKLVTIEPGYIEVETGGETKRYDLAVRDKLMPSDPPRHPVAMRPPPTANPNTMGGMGSPARMAGAGGPQPMPGSMPPGGSLDAARAQAMAAAQEASRRAAMPVSPPDQSQAIPFEKIPEEDRNMGMKYLSEPSIPEEQRWDALRRIGIYSGMPIDQAMVRMKEAGVDLNNEAGKMNIQLLEQNAKGSGPQGGKEGK